MDKYRVRFPILWGVILSIGFISSCSTYTKTKQASTPIIFLQSPIRLESYIESLADSLVLNSKVDLSSGRLAIGTILLQEQLKVNSEQFYPFDQLGTQIQEGLATYLMNRGLRVVEYRKTTGIVIHNDYDQMLSRDLARLTGDIELHYYLTGTISYEAADARVSLKIIDIESNEVFAAAYKNIPINIVQNKRQIIGHNGLLYRNSATY